MAKMGWSEWLGLIAFAAVVYWIDTAIRRRRSNALKEIAAELGFSFQGENKGLWGEGLARLRLLKLGSPGGIENVLKGQRYGVPVWIFDFAYNIGWTDSDSACTQTVAAFRVETDTLPLFELRPEGLAQKLGALVGTQDIDFPEAPVFSGRYLLRGSSVNSVRSLFHPGVLRLLEGEKGWSVEGAGHWLIVYRHQKQLKPHKIPEFLREAEAVFAAFHLS